MITIGYGVCVLVSILATLAMALRNYDYIDSYNWSVFLLLPFLIMAYWLGAQVSPAEASVLLSGFISMISSLLLAIILFSMLHLLGYRPRAWLKAVVYGVVALQLFFVRDGLSGGSGSGLAALLGTGEASSPAAWISRFLRYYAPLLAAVLFVISVVALLTSRRRRASIRSLLGYLFLSAAWLASYTVEKLLQPGFSPLPYLYALSQAVVVLAYDRVRSHDIAGLISTSQKSHMARGYVAVGRSGRFLSANEKSFDFFPELRSQKADSRFAADSEVGKRLGRIIENYTANGVVHGSFQSGDRSFAYRISEFSVRKSAAARGYLVDFRDATEEMKNLALLTDYNTRLNQEVAEKTRNIEAIQEKLVLSMADMVENRDGNTGGHVRRTSDIVAILVRRIREENLFPLEEELAREIVRTAPMHDLGKISIDSGILNKPARLTPEEYAVMKTHSVLSGQMVKILLEGVEEESLVRTAYRLARHHHERWDGKGYPDGLVGETIPLEARIMAVADVYDALVSKRVYKEPMSFEQAARIMCEGMGTQFDPNMRVVFLRCRKDLEQYYAAIR